MKIISLANQKGGVGKTTVALNLAYAFSKELNVGVYDADLQGSISNENVSSGLTIVPFQSDLRQLKTLSFDILIIDTPPYLTARLTEIFSISDLVIVPTKSSYLDAAAIVPTLALIGKAKRMNRNLKTAILLNQVKHNSSLSKEMRDLISELNVPVFDTKITDRVNYVRSLVMGGIMSTTDKTGKKQILDLCNEIADILND